MHCFDLRLSFIMPVTSVKVVCMCVVCLCRSTFDQFLKAFFAVLFSVMGLAQAQVRRDDG